MEPKADGTNARGEQVLPEGLVLEPPVSIEDLQADTEYDPEGAEEFAALIRGLRNERSRPLAL
jgi:hypothetical protein